MGPTAKIPIVFQWPVWPLINPQTKGFSDRRCQRMSVSQTIWRGAVDWAEPRRSGLARVIPAVLGSRVVRRVDRPVFGKMVWGREIDIDQQGRAVIGMVCLTTNLMKLSAKGMLLVAGILAVELSGK